MDLLPTGLAKLIPANPIRLNTEVTAIHWEGDQGRILLKSEKHELSEIQPTTSSVLFHSRSFGGLSLQASVRTR